VATSKAFLGVLDVVCCKPALCASIRTSSHTKLRPGLPAMGVSGIATSCQLAQNTLHPVRECAAPWWPMGGDSVVRARAIFFSMQALHNIDFELGVVNRFVSPLYAAREQLRGSSCDTSLASVRLPHVWPCHTFIA
jgi:hypothetical protein